MMNHLQTSFLPNWKAIVYIFIPGWVAFIPFAIIIYHFNLSAINIEKNGEYLFLIYFINSIVLGLIINELGSWIEGIYDDRINCHFPDYKQSENWTKYLLIKNSNEESMLMFSLIRDVAIRLKFGINIVVALLIILISLPILKIYHFVILETTWLLLIELLIFILMIIQFITSYYMAVGLSKYRKDLVEKISNQEIQ